MVIPKEQEKIVEKTTQTTHGITTLFFPYFFVKI